MQIRISFCFLHSQSRLVSEFWCSFWDTFLIKFGCLFETSIYCEIAIKNWILRSAKYGPKYASKIDQKNGVILDQKLLPPSTAPRFESLRRCGAATSISGEKREVAGSSSCIIFGMLYLVLDPKF